MKKYTKAKAKDQTTYKSKKIKLASLFLNSKIQKQDTSKESNA